MTRYSIHLGWGLLSQFPPFRYFPNFSALSKHPFVLEYHVYIWQVSPQLSCGDSCQIWMWLKESNSHFCRIENFGYGEINERSFSNPHPWWVRISRIAYFDKVLPEVTLKWYKQKHTDILTFCRRCLNVIYVCVCACALVIHSDNHISTLHV